ncbi:hypothetical protein FNV43_RR14719 [Rhamnella rubrinervis]|uniref:Heat shock protein 90 n=1 Tax=Rhamnella rubrinervis TaxID=2594499 RepID=A0A8K0MGH8_9ROSA|nr:hypothetical protein FNV43_RR14719 [Rhamnella rubrinervis]
MLPLRRSVTAIFGRIGSPRFRNAVAPVSFHPRNSSFEEYLWNNFGKYLQLEEDRENDKRIARALRFFSSQSDDDMISLDDYVENMLPEQKDIFYLNAAHSVFSANNYITPFLKGLAENNVEVLFLANPIDEVAIQNLKSYKGKNFVDASKEGYWMDMRSLIGIASAEQKGKEILKQKFGPTCELINKCLGDKVASVQISMKRRLSRPPCVLVTGKPIDWSANMERLMKKSQTVDHVDLMRSRRVFEINPQHLIIRRLHDALEDKVDEKHVHKLIDLLHFSALLALGFGGLTPGARFPWNEQIFIDTVFNAIDFCGRSKNRC